MSIPEILMMTRSDSMGSIAVRGVIWLVGVLVVATAVDRNKSERGIRVDVGWFFLFILTAGILSYFLFGFIPSF